MRAKRDVGATSVSWVLRLSLYSFAAVASAATVRTARVGRLPQSCGWMAVTCKAWWLTVSSRSRASPLPHRRRLIHPRASQDCLVILSGHSELNVSAEVSTVVLLFEPTNP